VPSRGDTSDVMYNQTKIAGHIVAILLALNGCTKDDSHGFSVSALRNAIAKNEVIELKKFTSFSWDRVHIFGPYAPPDTDKRTVSGSPLKVTPLFVSIRVHLWFQLLFLG
jgi:hypothetical protein